MPLTTGLTASSLPRPARTIRSMGIMCVCARARVRVCVRARARVCVCACVYVCEHARVLVCGVARFLEATVRHN
jgi:hypothetical protein